MSGKTFSHLKGRLKVIDSPRKVEAKNSGVQDEHVERLEPGQELGGEVSDRNEAAEIELHREAARVRPFAPDFSGGLFGPVEVPAGQNHPAAVKGQAAADLEPDSGIGAGDYGDPGREIEPVKNLKRLGAEKIRVLQIQIKARKNLPKRGE